MGVVTLIVLVFSIIRVRQWFGLAFSSAGHHEFAPTEGEEQGIQPSVDHPEIRREQTRQDFEELQEFINNNTSMTARIDRIQMIDYIEKSRVIVEEFEA